MTSKRNTDINVNINLNLKLYFVKICVELFQMWKLLKKTLLSKHFYMLHTFNFERINAVSRVVVTLTSLNLWKPSHPPNFLQMKPLVFVWQTAQVVTGFPYFSVVWFSFLNHSVKQHSKFVSKGKPKQNKNLNPSAAEPRYTLRLQTV